MSEALAIAIIQGILAEAPALIAEIEKIIAGIKSGPTAEPLLPAFIAEAAAARAGLHAPLK